MPLPLLTGVFLEVFSGSGRLSSAIAAGGRPALLWDISLGDAYDLRRVEPRRLILGWVAAGMVIGLHIATPCPSFSRARDHGPGPPRLRSPAEPSGLASLTRACDREQVRIGNLLARFSAALARAAHQRKIPWALENPRNSYLFLLAVFVALASLQGVKKVITEFCMWGTAWRKSTTFLHGNLDLSELAGRRCLGAKRGLCLRTGKKHVHLAGLDPDGEFRTRKAEAYPYDLCRALARAFDNARLSQVAETFEETIAPSSRLFV